LFPLLSINGSKEETDRVRGTGTYDKVISAADALTNAGVVWGIAFTLTAQNADVYDRGVIEEFINRGALIGRFLTYMPTGRDVDLTNVPSHNQRARQRDFLQQLNATGTFKGLDYLNDPGLVSGCQAAGIRYVHVDPRGNVAPCTFISFPSIFNLTAAYTGSYTRQGAEIKGLSDILVKDPFLRMCRELATKRTHKSCCLVIDAPAEFKRACFELAERFPIRDFGNFFTAGTGSSLLAEYKSRLVSFATSD